MKVYYLDLDFIKEIGTYM